MYKITISFISLIVSVFLLMSCRLMYKWPAEKTEVQKEKIASIKIPGCYFFEKKVRCWNDIDFDKTEKLLLNLSVQGKSRITNYDGDKPDVFLLSLKGGLKAVFKPHRDIMDQASALRAYYLSELLNFKLVPPTVRRTINGETGILQLFIEGATATDNNINNLKPTQKSVIYLFAFMLTADANLDNIIIGKNCKSIALIDNDKNMSVVSIVRYKDFPYIRFPISILDSNLDLILDDYNQFPFDKTQSIKVNSTLKLIDLKKKYFPHIVGLANDAQLLEPGELFKDTISFVKWRKAYWIQLNFKYLSYVYKNFALFAFQKEVNKLKSLGYDDLKSFSRIINKYFNKEELEIINKNMKIMNKFVIYKKDLILSEFEKFMN